MQYEQIQSREAKFNQISQRAGGKAVKFNHSRSVKFREKGLNPAYVLSYQFRSGLCASDLPNALLNLLGFLASSDLPQQFSVVFQGLGHIEVIGS